jgi:spermidine synthase
MKPWVTIAKSGTLTLQRRDEEWVIRSNGVELMSSRRHGSETALAAYARGRTLIGGLGLGFTLQAVSTANEIVVAELDPAVVEWNRVHLKTQRLDDPRVTVHVGDVAEAPGKYDAILLDVDNGPSALSDPRNAKLYGPAGISRFHAMLKLHGTLVVWSAGPDFQFVKRLGRGGFTVTVEPSGPHTLFVARRRSS